jgi:surfeit locus 1 family protein
VSIRIGRYSFSPSWGFTALTLIVCTAFVYLGQWQWHKGALRQAQWERFAQGSDRIVPLASAGVQTVPRFQRVSVHGRWEVDHQFLLDNMSHQGRAGFEVLTPLRRPDGRTLLIDRGWVPFSGMRTNLPDVTLETRGDVELTGRIADLPSPGLASGRAAPQPGPAWPKVTSFPSMAQLSGALGTELEPSILLLDPKARDGYVRDWHPPGMEPVRHWSYAVQWWCFGVVLLVLWVRLNTRRVAAGQ